MVINSVRDNAVLSFHDSSSKEMKHIDTTFSLYLHGLAEDAQFLANVPQIRQLDSSVSTYMNSPSRDMTPLKNSPVEAEAFKLMSAFGESHSDLAYVFLGMNHGGSLQWPRGKNGKNYDPRVRPWYKSTIDSTTPKRVAAYAESSTGLPVLDYMVRFEGSGGAFGSIGVDVTLSKLFLIKYVTIITLNVF